MDVLRLAAQFVLMIQIGHGHILLAKEHKFLAKEIFS